MSGGNIILDVEETLPLTITISSPGIYNGIVASVSHNGNGAMGIEVSAVSMAESALCENFGRNGYTLLKRIMCLGLSVLYVIALLLPESVKY